MRYILIILSLSLLLTSCGSQVPSAPLASTNLTNPLNSTEALAAVSPRIQQDKVFEVCMAQSVNMCSQRIIDTAMQEDKDTKICSEFRDTKFRIACENAINKSLAIRLASPELCENITDTTDAFLCTREAMFGVAAKSQKISDCTKFATIQRPSSTSLILPPGNDVDQCIMGMSIANSDLVQARKNCDSIKDTGFMKYCKSQVELREKVLSSS